MPPRNQSITSRASAVGKERIVVVVDDDVAVLNSLKFALEVEGFRVLAFTSAEEMMRAGALPKAACLVVDQHLPGKSGLELIHDLRAREGPFPAILVTGGASAHMRREAAGRAVAIVEKPFLGNALNEAIDRALG